MGEAAATAVMAAVEVTEWASEAAVGLEAAVRQTEARAGRSNLRPSRTELAQGCQHPLREA